MSEIRSLATAGPRGSGTAETHGCRPALLALPEAKSGSYVRIAFVNAGAVANRRLAEMGVRRGTAVQVVQNQGPDGVVLGLGDDRLALPRHLAAQIRVTDGLKEPLPEPEARA
jgi:Fe2+ transport system protein FeoA